MGRGRVSAHTGTRLGVLRTRDFKTTWSIFPHMVYRLKTRRVVRVFTTVLDLNVKVSLNPRLQIDEPNFRTEMVSDTLASVQ